jgi:hypothetical protein
MMNKDKQILKDMLGFLKYVHYETDMDKAGKYSMLIQTLAHDLNGLINEDKCFSPRVTGYSKFNS